MGLLQLSLTLPESYLGQLVGLLGNFNGDSSDDLLPRDHSVSVPNTSSDRRIFTDFGQTCEFVCFVLFFSCYLFIKMFKCIFCRSCWCWFSMFLLLTISLFFVLQILNRRSSVSWKQNPNHKYAIFKNTQSIFHYRFSVKCLSLNAFIWWILSTCSWFSCLFCISLFRKENLCWIKQKLFELNLISN